MFLVLPLSVNLQKSSKIPSRLGKATFQWRRWKLFFTHCCWSWSQEGLFMQSKLISFRTIIYLKLPNYTGFEKPAICRQVFRKHSIYFSGLLEGRMWAELHGRYWFHWYLSLRFILTSHQLYATFDAFIFVHSYNIRAVRLYRYSCPWLVMICNLLFDCTTLLYHHLI